MSTKSTPGAPKIVIAEYHVPERAWKIPFGVDLEDKTQVKDWWIKWEYLNIEYVDGRKQAIDCDFETEEDLKYPVEQRIDDADVLFIDFNEDIQDYLEDLEERKPKTFFDIQIKRLKRNPLVHLGFFLRLDRLRCGFC